MLALSPARDDRAAREDLDLLIVPARTENQFSCTIRRLHQRFQVYADTCPLPLPAPGLIVTAEIRRQSELYLPLAEVAAAFTRLYHAILSYPPILSSTTFHTALSWADLFVALPVRFQFSANPARLLEELLDRPGLLTEFLCASFLPPRFYGGFRRYPQQRAFVNSWLRGRRGQWLRCLDAACGTGEDSYGLALQLLENGYLPAQFQIEGWTIEPLEVWAAAHARFPHDAGREAEYRRETEGLFSGGADNRILFRTVDLLYPTALPAQAGAAAGFDLILCNGLLGGPILHDPHDLQKVVSGLAGLLVPGGILLVADSFHGGWKQKHPQDGLRALCESVGLVVDHVGEGMCAGR